MTTPPRSSTQTPDFSSIRLHRKLSHSNNSDDEHEEQHIGNSTGGSTGTSTNITRSDDFISFPTLADPEVFSDRGVSGIISKTLRKVTMNASKLVENYSSNFESPKSARSNGLENSPSTPKTLGLGLGMGATHPIDTVDATSINFDKSSLPHQYQQNRNHSKNPIKSGSILHGKSSVPNLQGVSSRSEHKSNKKLTGKIGNPQNDTMSNRGHGHGYGSLLQTSRDQMKQPDFLLAQQSSRPTVGISTTPNFKHKLVDNEAMVKNTKSEGLIKDNPSAMPSKDTNAINESSREMSHRIHTLPSDMSKIRKTQPLLSKVTSDNKSLRLSAAQFPTSSYINSSATSSVVNVNASATVEFSERPGETNAAKAKASKGEKALSDVRLREKQSRAKASTLFTNLPNDIEISDDSASDSDTIESLKDDENSKTDSASYENYQRHLNTHRHFNNKNNTNNNQHSSHHHQLLSGNLSSSRNTSQDTSRKTSVNSVKTQYEPGLGFAATVGKSSPIKGEISGKATFTTKMGNSPTITSFQALQSKDHRAIKRKSGNFSTQILDNAKSLINQNIGAVASSASSIVARRKKKKKKPRKISENPLKNGGIPKKYWMNDAYVTDCLNCFKPFTAFRRKHHCRFCGQIFCSDCMLFVSYNQHKDERRNLDKKPTYNDKLRVCKPCYSDVIIYLSDDSSSSSSSASSSILNEDRAEIGMDGSDYAIDEVQSLEKRGNELLVPNHPLARIRSLSTSTHKEGPSLSYENQRSQYDDSIKITDSLSACNSDSPSSHSNSQRIYPDDSIKSNLKQAPRMAIPTTRAGESVEIPIVRSSLSNMSIPRYGSSLKIETLSSNNPLQHSHLNHFSSTLKHHTNIHFQRQLHDLKDSPSSSKAWTTHASKSIIPDVPFSQSYENPSSFIRAPVSRKPSLKSRLRSELQNCSSNLYDKTVECNSDDNESTTSESSEDVDQTRSRIHLNRHLSNHLSRTYSTGEAGAEEEEEEEEEERRRRKEREEKDDDEEDEHAMSLYASLHGSFISNKNSHQISNLSYTDYNTVPTLGEFPMIRSFSNRELEYRQGLDSNHDLAKSLSPLSPQRPSSTNWRSKARANASLQRMRSRRQNKIAKNFSKLTPANIRTMSSNSPLSHSNLDTKLTPESSPTMRKASLSRLTSASGSDANKQDIVRKNLAREQAQEQLREREDNEMMPVINRQVSSSTVVHHHPSQQDLESSSDYFSFGQNRLNDEHDVFVSGIEESEKLENSYEATYDTYLLDLLKQSLNDVEVETDFDEWVTTLTKLMGSVSVLQLTDTLDVRQYIKIKRILGGKISSSYVLKGLFMTKNVDSRQMSSALDDPRIAVLMFPVEYLKQREQFISLRIIQAQQAVYISNLVSRLVSLEPDIIVVGDSVTGLAEKMLEESGITVLSNVKPQIVERISRYTGADVFQSVNDLFFKKGNLGTCKKFEVRRFQYGNKVKTFTFFSGTNMSRGFTFCLRGGDNLCLSKIKLVAELLTAPYLNARFEKSFFLNYCLNFNGVGNRKRSLAIFDVIDELQLKYEDSNSSLPQLGDDILNYIETFRDRIISSSPCVQYTLPAPLCNLIEAYKTYAAKFISNDQIQQLESSTLKDNEVLMQLSNENSGLSDIALSSKTDQDKETLRIIKFASNCSLQLLLNEYQSRRRIWTNCLKFPIYQLNPGLHRSIHVLFSSISIKYATPCLGPNIVVIDYYTENDKCIGQFLDQAFRESVHLCQECEEPLLEHYKTYVHGNMKIDLIVEKFDIRTDENGNKNFQGKDQRVMWTYCRECSHSTPIMAMSEDTYCLSLGKFFEMNFYGKNVHCECEHDYFPNYVKCFGYNDLVIRLECSKVDNYEIVIPKKRLEFIANTDIKLKMDSFNSIKSRAELFFESILKRLTRVKLDTFVKDEEKAEDGTKKINELKAKLRKDSQMVFDKLQKQFADIGVTNYLELNGVYKDLQKLGVSWDNEFNDFERRYLPSENEVNKITQFHLRKYLLDRYNNDKDKDLDEVQKSSDEKNGPVREEHEDDESKKTNEKSTNDNDFNASVDQRPTIPSSYSLSAPQIATKSAAASKTRGVESGTLNPIPEFVPRKPRELSDSRRFSDPNLEFKMFPQNSSLYEQSSNISERISKWEQTANDTKNTNSNENFHQNGPNVSNVRSESDTNVLAHRGSDSSLRSVTNVIPSQNKVTHLANFFDKMYYDQISQEFSKQREIEMKKRNRIRAQPIYDSKPIVEIYNKIEDVVGGTNELDLQKEKEKQKEKQEEKQKEKEKDKDKEKDKEKSNAKETSKSRNQRDGDHNQRESIAKAEEKLDTMKQAETPEKQSLLKSLTNFWADRSATLWDPLAYPLESHEHTFADSDVVVREDEPSSLVAFCLSSSDYRQKMKISFDDQKPGPTNSVNASSHELNLKKSMNFDRAKADNMSQSQNQNSNSNSNSNSNLNQNQKQNQKSRNEAAVVDVSSELKAQKLSQIDEESNDQSNAKSLDNNGKSEVPTNQVMKDFKFGFNSNTEKKSLQFAKLEKKFKQRGTPMTSQDTQLETILNQKRSNHLKYQLIDGNTNLSCKIFYCEQFQALRKAYGVDETFIQSLSRCVKWQSSGGKSGSSFLKTLDNRYILKELSKSELESFVSIAPFYFRYIGQSMFNTLTTAIAKIFGFYQVEIKNNATGKLFKMDFLIMENLFYNHNTTRIFDLKGSMRNRHVQQTGKENEVLLDENMIEYIYESPVFVREQSKKLLRGCLFNDTSFLSAMDVMDYSLVIGIDDVSKKLYIGIIDWLRTFTWDKKVENWVKGNNLIGGGKRGKDPTIVTPKQYRTRFREAMERYILEVPDIWYEGSK